MIDALERAAGRPVSRETLALLEAYVERLKSANSTQNLVAESTLDHIWDRHIADSAQLVRFEPRPGASWVDIGSGAGLPGVIIAALVAGPVTLVEPRRLRAEFLEETVSALGLSDRVAIRLAKIEHVRGPFDAITARAVAPLGRLLGMGLHLAHSGTIWALPKGRSAKSELAEARRSWQCEVRSETSCTDPQATILVLSKVKAKSKR
ncbi:16S rRNA (guanine(527)-N(7))-methyltransferase RsmG [Sphingomonas sp.]|uniref:16S rRNA (guanine(527)-N(7))-methyltransferase RsmG n=1 Tax=Sphingomonas sp. TaxID=28214 RepID=UPI0018364D65|nr:16S rRNA (guanine(527)-N(7))-methyltransferase RsmG [Sphingomonas sp.]MBA3510430.1 16S rRNA (guanine(527)-N(7))-methyltransferase RsmG [Sphingomonas sp.]